MINKVHFVPKIVTFFAVLVFVNLAYSEDENLGDVRKDLQLLSTKIDDFQQDVVTRLSKIEQKLTKIENSKILEVEAQKAFQEIGTLAKKGDFEQAKQKMVLFMSKYGATPIASRAVKLQQELNVIGKEAPGEWNIDKWFQGESEIVLNGDKTTLLVFWETWCPHCRREVPKIQNFYATYKERGLQIIGMTKVNRSATDDGVKEFIDKEGLQYPIAKEDGSISRYFNVSGVPAAAVLKKGEVIWRGHPASLSEDLLEKWL